MKISMKIAPIHGNRRLTDRCGYAASEWHGPTADAAPRSVPGTVEPVNPGNGREATVAKEKPSNHAHYVSADQLRIGLYVHVDLPWFRHPFTLNSFRIASAEQVRALRALGEPRFRYDPQRSTVAPDAGADVGTDPAPAAEAAAGPADVPAPPGDEPAPTPAEALSGKRQRVLLLNDHRRRLGQVNRSFLKSAMLLRNLNRNLMSDPEATLHEIGALVEQMVAAFLEHPAVTLHLMGEECGGDDIYSHSLNVTVLAMMLAKGLDFPPEQARVLGLGALLHDIGLMDVPDRLLKMRPDEYTKPERDLRAMHCEFGLHIGRQLGLPADILSVIFQHHEMVDGSGYPRGIGGDRMTPPARVVSLVNYYERLCNPADPTQGITPHEALSFLFGQKRGKFDAVALQRLIRCLGVYPPGSIVTLSNDATAVVMSVNPARPLRPWVMVYDESVPREEAILLDLERETDINIAGAVRPAMLPPAVIAYLSPGRRMVYFFDSEARPDSKGNA